MNRPLRAGALVIAMTGALVIGAMPAVAAGTITFAPVVNYPTGSSFGPGPGAETTVHADFNGDRHDDIAFTDYNDSATPVEVMLNRGDGTFGAPLHLAGPSAIGSLAVGDFNRDGKVDLVGTSDSQVAVWLGHGDGTFTQGQQFYLSPQGQASIAVFDTNRDGILDIVVPVSYGIQVLLGNGDGTFRTGPVTSYYGLISDLAQARLDTDSNPDLAVLDATPGNQHVVAFKGNGDGTFTQTGTGATDLGPESVTTGDLNGDGIDDVVTADSFSVFNSAQFRITVLLSNGHGGFGTPAHYAVGAGPVSGVIADLNGDGVNDVVVSSVVAGTVSVYAGLGGGQLSGPAQVTVTPLPQSPVVTDLDGDGRPDVAVPGPGNLSVLRNIS